MKNKNETVSQLLKDISNEGWDHVEETCIYHRTDDFKGRPDYKCVSFKVSASKETNNIFTTFQYKEDYLPRQDGK